MNHFSEGTPVLYWTAEHRGRPLGVRRGVIAPLRKSIYPGFLISGPMSRTSNFLAFDTEGQFVRDSLTGLRRFVPNNQIQRIQEGA